MSNNFSGVVRQHWANDIQASLEKTLTAMDLATQVDIPDGVTKKLPLVDDITSQTYQRNTDVTFKDLSTGADEITIDQTPLYAFNIDELDKQDNYIDVVPEAISKAAQKLRESIDGKFFAEIANAEYTLASDGLDLTTGSETPLALTTGASQNVTATYGDAMDHLIGIGAGERNLVIVADPNTVRKFSEVGIDKGFTIADENLSRGMTASFIGMPVYRSALLKHSVVLALATNPTAGDTVTVRGVKFTFVASIGTAAGNVLIGASADATRANLVAAINGAAGAGTTYVEVSQKNRVKLEKVTATNDDSANTATIVSIAGPVGGRSALTAASDKFGAEASNTSVMSRGAIHMALRRNVEIETRKESRNLGENYFIYSRYGVKTTTSGKERMVRVLVQNRAAE